MRLQGKDAISSATKVSSRTLLSVSGIVLFILTYGAPIEKFSMLGLEFAGKNLASLFPILLTFLIVNHVVQWIADLLSFRAWNLVGLSSDVDQRIGSSSLTTKLDLAMERIRFAERRLSESNEKPREQDQRHSINTALEFLSVAENQLSSFRKEVLVFNWYARFYVYFWYLTLPVGVALIALYLSIK